MATTSGVSGEVGGGRLENARARLDRILAGLLSEALAAAQAVLEGAERGQETGPEALRHLDDVLAQAMTAAELLGEDELRRGVAARREIVSVLMAESDAAPSREAALRLRDEVAAIPELVAEHASDAEGPGLAGPVKGDAQRAGAAPPDVVQDEARTRTVALAPEDYDLVHEDEDADLIGYFLEALQEWTDGLKSHLPGVTRPDSKFAYGETLDQLQASANYLDIPWLIDLVKVQRRALGDLERGEEVHRRDAIATLTDGAARLSLLLQPREQALSGLSLQASPVIQRELPARGAQPLPPEFATLADLGRTLASIASAEKAADRQEWGTLRREIDAVVRQIRDAHERLAARLSSEEAVPTGDG